MTHELRDQGLQVGRRRKARLMRDNGLKARQKRRFKRTTDSEHAWPIAPNLIDQDFTAQAPNQKWSADISYVWTREGWLYLAVVIDLFSRGGLSAGRSATACTAAWRSRLYAGPWRSAGRKLAWSIIRTAAANTAPSTTRPSCAATASRSPCPARETATTTPWSKPSSRP